MKQLVYLVLITFLVADESWKIYDDSTVGRVDIAIDPVTLNWIYNNVESDSLHPVTIYFHNAHIDETVENVGFRLRGNTSRQAQKKSFKLDFNHFVLGRNFFDVEKIDLNGEHNDVSIIRSKLSWEFYKSMGMTAPRANHVAVYINDQYFGLYISVEHIDDTFLGKNFPDDSGNLWKCLWPADLTYRGPDAEDYHPWVDGVRPYELKTNEDEYNFAQLARLINIINHDPDSLEHVLDVSAFIQYLAVNIITGSWDDYRSLRNNFYLYHNPAKDQFTLIPYDYDNTFGVDWFNVDWANINPYTYYFVDDSDRPLAEMILNNDQLRNLFTHFLIVYNEHFLNNDFWFNWVDSTKSMIDSSVYYDLYRTYDYGFTFQNYLDSFSTEDFSLQHVKKGLKEFMMERSAALNSQIQFINTTPVVYDHWVNPAIPVVGDSITIHALAFGYPQVDHSNVIVHDFSNGTYSSYPLQYHPSGELNWSENEDHWFATIPPIEHSTVVGLRLLTTNSDGQTGVNPATGEWLFAVNNPDSIENIFINEFLALNNATNVDEFGENDDWVELYNASADTVFLGNLYLTDDVENLTQWQFPDSVNIPPYGFILIWCDNDEEQGELHANFKLSSDGEFIALVNLDGITIIDSVSFGVQNDDISYGRLPDGNSNWNILSPTPLAINQGLGIKENELPDEWLIYTYPNPFNDALNIQYTIPKEGNVKISILDILGRSRVELQDKSMPVGNHQMIWDGKDQFGREMPSGVWFVQIQIGEILNTNKVLYLK